MDEKRILSEITSIINDDLGLDSHIDPAISLLKNNVMDSMDWISFLTIVEEKFNVVISPEDAARYQIGIVQNLVDYLKERTHD